MALLIAKFGGLTRIVTTDLAAKYCNPMSASIGATLGLWAVAAAWRSPAAGAC